MQTRGIEPATFQQQDAGSTPEPHPPWRRQEKEKEGEKEEEEEEGEEGEGEEEEGEKHFRFSLKRQSSYIRFFMFHMSVSLICLYIRG